MSGQVGYKARMLAALMVVVMVLWATVAIADRWIETKLVSISKDMVVTEEGSFKISPYAYIRTPRKKLKPGVSVVISVDNGTLYTIQKGRIGKGMALGSFSLEPVVIDK